MPSRNHVNVLFSVIYPDFNTKNHSLNFPALANASAKNKYQLQLYCFDFLKQINEALKCYI